MTPGRKIFIETIDPNVPFFFYLTPNLDLSYLLQSVVELHRPEQEALLAPQGGADLLAHSSELAALGPDGVLGIVGVFYQPVAFAGQGQGTVECVLLKHGEDQNRGCMELTAADASSINRPLPLSRVERSLLNAGWSGTHTHTLCQNAKQHLYGFHIQHVML